MFPKAGDLFYTLYNSELHLFLFKENDWCYFYGPLKSKFKDENLEKWKMGAERAETLFAEGSWRIINAPEDR